MLEYAYTLFQAAIMGALFLFVPTSTIVLIFFPDLNRWRALVINTLMVVNTIAYLLPLIVSFFNTPPGRSMWDPILNADAGLMWVFLAIGIMLFSIQVVLVGCKLVFYFMYRSRTRSAQAGGGSA